MNSVNIINLTGNPFDGDNLPGIDSETHRNFSSIRVEHEPFVTMGVVEPFVNMEIIAEAELQIAEEILNRSIDIFEPTFIILQMNPAQLIIMLFIVNLYNYYQLDPVIWFQDKNGVYIDTHDFVVGTYKVREAISKIQGDILG